MRRGTSGLAWLNNGSRTFQDSATLETIHVSPRIMPISSASAVFHEFSSSRKTHSHLTAKTVKSSRVPTTATVRPSVWSTAQSIRPWRLEIWSILVFLGSLERRRRRAHPRVCVRAAAAPLSAASLAAHV